MRRLMITVALVALALIFSSCTTRGEIRVRNYSTTDVTVEIDYSGDVYPLTRGLAFFDRGLAKES